MENMSLSDIAAVTRGTDMDGFGGGGLLAILVLFLFLMMGNRDDRNRRSDYGDYATAASQQEILYGQQFGQLNDRLTNLGNGVCNLGYEMQGGIGQLGKEVALGQSNLQQTIMGTGNGIQQQIASCCCENRLAMANLSAQMDRQTCDITTAIHAEGEQTRALMQANTIQQLRDKVSALELAGQMSGVVRYPTGYAYNAGPSPFCGGGCAACA